MKRGTRMGISLALGTALISGVSIPINKVAVGAFDNVTLFTTVKNSIVGILLLSLLLMRVKAITLAPISRRSWAGLGVIALIGGSIPFLLFFQGLALASAPSAALIHKTLFLWVALAAVPLLGEKLGRWTYGGVAVLLVGQLIVGWPAGWGWGTGEWMILGATLFWTAETILVKRLLPDVPLTLAATARMSGGAIVMWGWLVVSGQVGGLTALGATEWAWILLTAVLLFGYVTTWYGALSLAPATVVTSVLTLGVVVSAVVATVQGSVLAARPITGLLVMVFGAATVVVGGLARGNVEPAAR
jgi:drug/metabolite transporter (DMT)-like permease